MARPQSILPWCPSVAAADFEAQLLRVEPYGFLLILHLNGNRFDRTNHQTLLSSRNRREALLISQPISSTSCMPYSPLFCFTSRRAALRPVAKLSLYAADNRATRSFLRCRSACHRSY